MKTKIGIKLKLGDVIINNWASERNPNRKLIVMGVNKYIDCINSKGEGIKLINDSETSIKVLGNCIDMDKFNAL